ncbi:putative nucleotidyltransferase substrate binding domain-containing protein [Novispirillum itersonii]|uniref:putative nucleotidyltransferase substrate binding domain-containing protein n=1 Tax=Novispirillum itersonii TaxID=189 RepID=UPI00037E27E5|nr:putative nucleotidyltransferase substrate binding domain-containing protein [Novispirillum itersonii]
MAGDAFDFSIPPFDRLTTPERAKVAAVADIAYYRPQEKVIQAGQPVDFLFVVMKGLVIERAGDEVITVYGAGDSFGAMALIHGAEAADCEAQEETLVHLLPRQLILDLCRSNGRFERFFTHSVSERLAERANVESARGMAAFMVARVHEAYLHPPITVPATTPLRDAAKLMKHHRATSLLVEHDDGRIGVLSGSDLREAALIHEKPLSTPVGDCATFGTIMIDADDFLFNAQVLMTRHSIRRLPVIRDGHVIGVLELLDLLSYMSSHSHLVAVQIDRAGTLPELAQAAQALDPLLTGLHGSGVKIRYIAEMVSDLSRKMQRRLYGFLATPELQQASCLMVMGSEGRGEQIAKTDQDNALILSDEVDPGSLRSLCEQFTEAMLTFGYPRCPGNMMVSNPEWCRTESQFRDELFHWIMTPSERSFLNLAAFLDGEAVAGDPLLLHRLRSYLFDRLTDNAGFLANFARPALSFDTPIGFFHQLVLERGERRGTIDIKKGGIFPVVHGVRALALEKHLHTCNTFERIEGLTGAGLFDAAFAADLTEALQFLMEMRLAARVQQNRLDAHGSDNYVQAAQLTKLQHDGLRDSLKIVKAFKQLVAHHFKLGSF